MKLLLRALAAFYDWLVCLCIMSWVVWGELLLHRLLGLSSGAWTDIQVGWSCELVRFGERNGLPAWKLSLLDSLPWLAELTALYAVSILIVMLLRRILRVTPGEWTFSVRRPPASPAPGGIGRLLLRVLAGLAAFVVGVVLWTLASITYLDPV